MSEDFVFGWYRGEPVTEEWVLRYYPEEVAIQLDTPFRTLMREVEAYRRQLERGLAANLAVEIDGVFITESYLPAGGDMGIDYSKVGPKEMMASTTSQYWAADNAQLARGWVEAVNVQEVWVVVGEWFVYLQEGKVPLVDPFQEMPSQEVADKLVEELDEDVGIERRRLGGLGRDAMCDFHRFEPKERLAFAQAIFATMKTDEEIDVEAREMIEAGVMFDSKGPVEKEVGE